MGKNGIRTWQPPQLTTKAKIGIALIVIIFGGAVATLIVTSMISKQLTDTNDIPDFSKQDAETRQKDAFSSSAEAVESGNSDKADEVYKAALAAESDPTKKVRLAINQSTVLYTGGWYDDAVKVALEAEAFSKDQYLISDWLGDLYSYGKRYDSAATYYTKAASLVDSPTNTSKYAKKYYENKASSMKAMAAKQ